MTPASRLSLVAGVPYSAADIAVSTSIHVIGCAGNLTPVFDGTAFADMEIPVLSSVSLDPSSGHTGYHQAGKNFDVFAFVASGVLAFGTGPAWGSDTARGTGAGTTEIEWLEGQIVNAVSIQLRTGSGSGDLVTVPARQATYLGSFRATQDGVATDTKLKRLLFNPYNVAQREIASLSTTATYVYNTTSYRIVEGDSARKIEMLFGLPGVMVEAVATNSALNSNGSPSLNRVKIGVDSTTVADPLSLGGNLHCPTNQLVQLQCFYRGVPGEGYHYMAQLEYGGGLADTTWYAYSDARGGLKGSFLS